MPSRRHTCRAGAEHHRWGTSTLPSTGRHLPGLPACRLSRSARAGRCESDLDAAANSRSSCQLLAAASCVRLGRLHHGHQLRAATSGRDTHHPSISAAVRRIEIEADSQGRRLRKRQRAVRTADGAAASRSRTVRSKGCHLLHAVWNAQGKGPATRVWLASASVAIAPLATRTPRAVVPHARRCESGCAAGRAQKPTSWGPSITSRDRSDGVWRTHPTLIGCKIGALNRLPAKLLRLGGPMTAGRIGVLAFASMPKGSCDQQLALSRSVLPMLISDARPVRLPACRSRGRTQRAAQ